MNDTPVSVNTDRNDEPIHVRLDRCVPAARTRQRALCAWPRITADGRLVIGGAVGPRHAYWIRGGEAIRDALHDAGASEDDLARFAPLFDLPPEAVGLALYRINYGGTAASTTAPPHTRAQRATDPPKPAPVPRYKARREARAKAEIDLFAEATT